jgi:hypothetical protein
VARRKRFGDVLDRLAAAEERAFAAEFLAPLLRGGVVQVRIAGVICRLKVGQTDFQGWGVFRASSARTAELRRPATLAERRHYLDLLPLVRLIVVSRAGAGSLAIPAHRGDKRFRIEGMVAVRLVEDAQLFDVIRARFDGTQCWYDEPEPRHDPGAAAYLRESLVRLVPPNEVSRPGLTTEEVAAYVINYAPRLEARIQAERNLVDERLRVALAHAGAALREYQEHGDSYRVIYEVDGRRHISVIDQGDLSVQAAGICLSGEDRRFDLQSLVGVLRQGRESGQVAPADDEGEDVPENDA